MYRSLYYGASCHFTGIAASGYTFSRWSGHADCVDGSVTMNTNKTAPRYFHTDHCPKPQANRQHGSHRQPPPAPVRESVTSSRQDQLQTIVSAISLVELRHSHSGLLIPARFLGWSGDADAPMNVTMNSSKSCTATLLVDGYFINVILKGNGKGRSPATRLD